MRRRLRTLLLRLVFGLPYYALDFAAEAAIEYRHRRGRRR